MVTYVEREPVPEKPAKVMLQIVESNAPMKPWTLCEQTETELPDDSSVDVRTDVLKPLMLRGVLIPNADGDMRVYEKDRLDTVVGESDGA